MTADRFVLSPNLPESNVTLCVCSDDDTARALASRGTEVLKTAASPFVLSEVSLHADMQMCHIGGNTVVVDVFQTDFTAKLRQKGFNVITDASPTEKYPYDIRFNAAVCGGSFFGNMPFLSAKLRDAALSFGLNGITVRQGYAKCSVCTVTNRAVITDDRGIAAAAKRNGFDVLEIEKGDILLSDRHFGFIGGCCGKISKTSVAFTGSLDTHVNGAEIRDFLHRHNCEAVELSAGKLKDVGGILPVKEEN